MSATVHHGPDNPVTGKELFGKWNWDVPVDAHWEKLSLIEKQKWNIFARKVNLKDVTPPEPVERRTNVNNLTEADLDKDRLDRLKRLCLSRRESDTDAYRPKQREERVSATWDRKDFVLMPRVQEPIGNPASREDWKRDAVDQAKFVREQPGSLYTGRKVDAEYEGSPADLHDRAEQAFKDAVKATAEDPVLAKRFIEQFIGNFVDDAALFLR